MGPLLLVLVLSQGPARALALPPPDPSAAPARPAEEAAAEARALLGAIDTPVHPARWRALGPAGRAVLEAALARPGTLPTRKARAVDGLAALGVAADGPRFQALALDEALPVVVRLAAVRALGVVTPAGGQVSALGPVLESAGDARVRAAAAEALVARQVEACPQVLAQVAREPSEVRRQFEGALRTCSPDAFK